MEYVKEIILEVDKENFLNITAQQLDTARVLNFRLLNNGENFSLFNRQVRFLADKPDNTQIFNDCTIVDAEKGQCKLKLTNQVLAKEGVVKCQLKITEGEDVLKTTKFNIIVNSSLAEGNIESTNEFSVLDKALAQTEKYNKIYEETSGKLEEKYTTRLTDVKTQTDNIKINPLYIETFDGSNQPYHPSVLYFQDGWNGWKYWLAYTPFPLAAKLYTDRWECPCIAVSNNGNTWTTPVGLKNPLDDLTEDEIAAKGYCSDPCLVMNGSTMEIWYRRTSSHADKDTTTKVYRRTSTDGVTWTEKELVQDGMNSDNGIGGEKHYFRSQQIFYQDSKYIAIWSDDTKLYRAECTNPATGIWTNMQTCTLEHRPTTRPWHQGVYFDTSTNTYHLIGYFDADNQLEYYTSTDALSWKFEKVVFKVDTKVRGAGIQKLYQSVPLKIEDGRWRIYVGCTFNNNNLLATDINMNRNGIFILEGKDLNHLAVNYVSDNDYSKKYFNADIVLNNYNNGTNFKQKRLVLGLDNNNKEWSIGATREPDGKMTPDLYVGGLRGDANSKNTFLTIRRVGSNPTSNDKPRHRFELWHSYVYDRLYISLDGETWTKILTENVVNAGTVINSNKTTVDITNKTSISAKDCYKIVINKGTTTQLDTIVDGVEGQELIIINVSGSTIQLKHRYSVSKDGFLNLNGGDRTLPNNATIKFSKVSAGWYEI